jgi:N-acetylmuramoyl-L-alanine amidase
MNLSRASPNFDARNAAIELVVLHYTGMQNAEVALRRLTDPAPLAGDYPGPWQAPDIDPTTPLARVSVHYVVAEEGQVYRLVEEESRAWHAGVSHWRGRDNVNARSVGIEIVNGGHDFGLPPFPEPQIAAVTALVRDILQRRGLRPCDVVGHSDIAPERKDDPGERFPWRRLADAGVSIWPQARPGDLARLPETLAAIGYNAAAPLEAQIRAFHRRFRPELVGAPADATSAGMAEDIARLCAGPDRA